MGICLNFNLAAEGNSPEQLKQKMNEGIISYIETVLDTDDKESIPRLLSRRAPIRDWIFYYCIKATVFILHLSKRFTFEEAIPFHLAHSC